MRNKVTKQLVTMKYIERGHELDMHDLIQEMGFQIVRESSPNTRLCQHEQICDLIKGNMRNLEAIEAIMSDIEYHIDDYDAKFGYSILTGVSLLPNLYISLMSCDGFVGMTNMCKLVGLEMAEGNIKHLWEGRKVHESLGSHQGLVYLDMSDCTRLKHHPSRIKMESLETLILFGCKLLERFLEVSPCMEKLSPINLYSFWNKKNFHHQSDICLA
uniref:Disease resistance protein Roq1-like winged-helix domain-containing protein n=1 Tax=Lactuca sativa TaxID=4236 RepID=A0A9R1VBN7_LACSA|nr:hypothetical protein LSAT_V11C600327090 [Lactuca sativa]